MAGGTPFVLQLIEALSALSIPVGGGLAAYAKWRSGAQRDRRAREEAARIASEKAAADVRKEAAEMLTKLLAEKDARATFLEKQNAMLQDENEKLHHTIQVLLSGGKPDKDA